MITHLLGILLVLILIVKIWLDQRKRFYQRFPGCKDNGHWFFGNVVTLNALTPKETVEKFPKFYRYCKGLSQYRISCYHPELIAKVLENCERPPNDVYYSGAAFKRVPVQQSCRKQWERYRDILHHSHGIERSKNLTDLCHRVFISYIDSCRIRGERKVDLNKVLGMIYECSNRLWFGNLISKSERCYINKLTRIYKYFALVRQDLKKKEKEGCNSFLLIFDYIKTSIHFIILKREFHKAHNTILKMRQNKTNSDGTGVLNWLIRTEKEQGKYKLTDDDYTALFKANHSVVDIVGDVLKLSILQLALHTEWQEKVRQEIVHTKDNFKGVTYQDTKYLKWFIQEVFRNRVHSLLPRTLNKPITYDGYEFPKGTVMDINLGILHRNPDIWKNADRFQPDRFAENIEFCQFLPFSAMDRMCPGRNLTLSILTDFYGTFLQRVKFDLNFENQVCLDQVYMSFI